MTFMPPTEKEIAEIFRFALRKKIISAHRFPTGLAHYVYDVQTEAGNFALRVARPGTYPDDTGFCGVKAFRAALYWYGKLKPLGVPLPEIYYEDIEAKNSPFNCYIMERLEGKDLYLVYSRMTAKEKEKLAGRISDIQDAVGTLPHGRGFGWTFSDLPPNSLKASWLEYAGGIGDKRDIIGRIGVFPVSYVGELELAMAAHREYFDRIEPVPFLDDIQGKNVIINDRHELSGVVDVDGITYGDRIYNMALTRMALWADTGTDPMDYIWMLADKLGISAAGIEALRLYTLQFCVGFMAEVGRAFNKDAADIDPAYVDRLKHIFGSLRK